MPWEALIGQLIERGHQLVERGEEEGEPYASLAIPGDATVEYGLDIIGHEVRANLLDDNDDYYEGYWPMSSENITESISDWLRRIPSCGHNIRPSTT